MVSSLLTAASVLAVAAPAMAGFDATKQDNIAVYWGQNSAGKDDSQDRLATYCQNANIDIIPIAFMDGISPTPDINFASASNACTKLDSGLLKCPQIEEDIIACQKAGKTITLSIGGATYTAGGFASADDAKTQADNIWKWFGPVAGGDVDTRPFGAAVVDGFDFDFENPVNNIDAFAKEFRTLMDTAHSGGDKQYYLTAAPQCVFPDSADHAALDSVAFDFVMIQFYNNWCETTNYTPGTATQNAFNFDVWDNWAKNTSPNKDVKLLLGIPASTGAAGAGYVSGDQLSAALEYTKNFTSFAGVMMWDMSQLYTNTGFLDALVADLA